MKKGLLPLGVSALALLLGAAGSLMRAPAASAEASQGPKTVREEQAMTEEENAMKMSIAGVPVRVEWEANESVEALKALCEQAPLEIQMSMYGGFEQVGAIGEALPRNDAQTTTQAGDVVLYAGDQIVVFYGSNSWAYTRLGHIAGLSAQELQDLLGKGNVAITLSAQ